MLSALAACTVHDSFSLQFPHLCAELHPGGLSCCVLKCMTLPLTLCVGPFVNSDRCFFVLALHGVASSPADTHITLKPYTLNLAVAAVQVPTNLAKGIKLVPIKLARGVKQLADGDDNKKAVISDIFPKPAEASA